MKTCVLSLRALIPKFQAILLALILGGVLFQPVNGQIFITDTTTNKVLAYSTSGELISDHLISLSGSPGSIVFTDDHLIVSNFSNNKIGVFDLDGTLVKSSLISGLKGPDKMALSGDNLYIVDLNPNNFKTTIREYNALTGTAVNSALIANLGISAAGANIAISGNNLFLTISSTIYKYNATTGALVSNTFITGLGSPYGMAVVGNSLFIASYDTGIIGEYNATTGAAINASLVTGLTKPRALAIADGILYVADNGGTIGSYTTSGSVIDASLITGLDATSSFVVVPMAVPEPSSYALMLLGLTALGLGLARRPSRR